MPLYDVTFPYIRMMAGQVDFTPGAMRNGTRDNWKAIYTKPISMGTRCHQAACYIVQDSPFTMLADTPTNYEADEPYTQYIASLPVVFDKTIAVIHKASASQHIFLVVRNPQSARKLVEGGVPIDKLGNHFVIVHRVSQNVSFLSMSFTWHVTSLLNHCD